ncbi:MAG: PA-phosphatase [Paracoccus denitrificans]|nr:MAG: PA-phosphatase [Paracoccus denitrificans]PZO84719.1 MAG: PA-phosphatase [Paracoccus denitrificans]
MTDDVGGQIEEADVALSVEAGKWRDHPVVETLGFISEVSDQPPAFTLAGLSTVAGIALGRPRLAAGGARALASLMLATFVKGQIKKTVVRTRPYKLLEEGEYETGVGGPNHPDYNSFPSGHTADAFAAATAVARVAPDHRGSLMAAAGFLGLIQVPRAKHHLADVVAGALVGIAAEAVINAAVEVAQGVAARAAERAKERE